MAVPNVFVSYASDTRPLAEQLTQALNNEGIQSWVDFKNLQPGQQFQRELDRAIEQAECFLILVGPKSRATPWQDAEWRAVLTKAWTDSGKRVLPVVVGSSQSPPFLRNWVSLNVDPSAEPETWTRRVVDALESMDAKPTRASTPRAAGSGTIVSLKWAQPSRRSKIGCQGTRARTWCGDCARASALRSWQTCTGSVQVRFINCPFDAAYAPIFDAIVFATVFCGFIPRSALESGDVSEPRLARIARAIFNSRYSIHDLSRCTGEGDENFARFNMPLELGMAMARRFAGPPPPHDWLVLVPRGHAYLRFASDLAAYDPATHDGSVESVTVAVIAWLATREEAVPAVTPDIVLSALPQFTAMKLALAAAWRKIRRGPILSWRQYGSREPAPGLELPLLCLRPVEATAGRGPLSGLTAAASAA